MLKSFVVVSLLFSTLLFAQESSKKFDVRFGAGLSLLGSGDMTTLNFENELNYKFSDYFSGSTSLNYGRSNDGVFETASFIQGNLNLFISPFQNNGRNDFRIGAGLTIYNISDARKSSDYYSTGENSYDFDQRSSIGFNLIIENSYAVTDNLLIGLKLFTQRYTNDDINSGGLLKLGWIL